MHSDDDEPMVRRTLISRVELDLERFILLVERRDARPLSPCNEVLLERAAVIVRCPFAKGHPGRHALVLEVDEKNQTTLLEACVPGPSTNVNLAEVRFHC